MLFSTVFLLPNHSSSQPPFNPHYEGPAFSIALFPTLNFTSFFLLYLSLFICLSVYLSVRHLPLHTLTYTRSESATHSLTHFSFTLFTHWLIHSPALTYTLWLGLSPLSFFFFLYFIHGDCTYVTTWICKIGLLLWILLFYFFPRERAIDERKERKKKENPEIERTRTYVVFQIFLFWTKPETVSVQLTMKSQSLERHWACLFLCLTIVE